MNKKTKIFLFLIILSIYYLFQNIFYKKLESYHKIPFGIIENMDVNSNIKRGKLFLIPESFGFNVPEITNISGGLIPRKTAIKYFDKVIVCANSANYSKGDPKNIMKNQWKHKKISILGLPIEKWAFVCCNDPTYPGKAANELIPNLITDYPDIKGFIIDYEDPKSVTVFAKVFKELKKNNPNKYEFGIIGFRGNFDGWKEWSKNHGNFLYDYYFNELYTEGMYYNEPNTYYSIGDNAPKPWNNVTCPSDNHDDIKKFWYSASKSCDGKSIIPTVCGAGNCQEVIWKKKSDIKNPISSDINNICFDERLSGNFIDKLLKGKENIVPGNNFSIWYGTGKAISKPPTEPVDCGPKPSLNGNWGCYNSW